MGHATGGPLDAAPAWLRAVLAGLGAAFVSAALICTPVFLTWLTSAYTMGSGGQAVQVGLAMWLLGQGVGLGSEIGPITLVPWLLIVVPFLCLVWAGQWALTALDPEEDGPRWAWAGGLRRDVGWVAVTLAVTYAVAAVAAGLAARSAGVAPHLVASAVLPLLLALAAMAPALRHQWGLPWASMTPGFAHGWGRLPLWARRSLHPAGVGVVALTAAGALGAIAFVVVRGERIAALYDQLDPGFFGTVMLTLGQLLYLPTMAIWALSFLAGPGFGIGVDSSITWAGSDPGLLPLIPVLGALPEPGGLPPAMWTIVLVPIAVGALIGWRSMRGFTTLASWRAKAAAAATACGLAGVTVGALSALASGSVGAGRLADVGARPLLVTLAVTLELAVGAALCLGAAELRLRRGRRQPRPAASAPRRGKATD